MGSGSKLFRNIGVAYDRPRDELGEQRDVQGKVERVLLGGTPFHVYVGGIADKLEGVERNPDRKGMLRNRQVHAGDEIEVGCEESGILIPDQRQNGQDHRQHKPQFPPPDIPFGQIDEQVRLRDGKQHQQNVDRFADRVENQRKQEENDVFCRTRHEKITRQQHRQKIEQKRNT